MGEVSTATVPPLTRLELTSTEKIFFSDITFYESGIDFAEGSAVAIAMRVCWQDKQMSILLVKNVLPLLLFLPMKAFYSSHGLQAVARLFEVISDWVSNAFIEHIVNFLKSITTIDDGLFLPRVEVLLSSAKGVVTMMNDERRATNMYRTSSMTSPLPDKYDMVLENLMTHPQIQAYVVHMAESNENFRFARDKISQLRPQTGLKDYM